MVNMPDLSESEQISEQRKVIKFWIDHCHDLEEKIVLLEARLKTIAGSNEQQRDACEEMGARNCS